ncbi:hypothetical protein RM190_22680 [Paracoccus sp. CPCC 101403]|uniref:Uncharacterized protein n=1 Tax=Paracoccus broussonetiae TaxID=3075834 RepID=A0ABU3EKA6_9RHOB|nr:hypothetical protein [Paracoccus sp. CPCC 101403]MDT1064679.1 hypothetical protein [Paracoccus sp. CPCC 101403]
MQLSTGIKAFAVMLIAVPSGSPAYPIDCAILLCLAGGFPASTECTPAKVEMIRRITPFPVEPPLQLWNCPMGGGGGLPTGEGPRQLPPEVRAYRDAIELYHIDYSQKRGGGDMHIRDRSRQGRYDVAGNLSWSKMEMREAPSWIFAVTGGDEQKVKSGFGTIMFWRGVLMRWRDYQGKTSEEWVPY